MKTRTKGYTRIYARARESPNCKTNSPCRYSYKRSACWPDWLSIFFESEINKIARYS